MRQTITFFALTACATLLLSCGDQKELVWEDNFDTGSTLDTSRWNIVVGNGCPELCGFGNNELQYYTGNPKNLRVTDGHLIIEAHKDSIENNGYTSAKITTESKGDWQYGRIEVRAMLPRGRGTWPAVWMLPTLDRPLSWPADGEIDVMEHVGFRQGWVHGTLHTELFNGMNGKQKTDSVFVENADSTFHVYAIEWDEKGIDWYVDDKKYNSIRWEEYPEEEWPFDKPFHLILNVAVGGNWGGKYGVDDTIWPQEMAVEYVRVYQ